MDENRITYFGQTDARGGRLRFGIKAKDRTRHLYVIGKTGMGKSTLLENMAIQDIQNGEGLAFIDPHGKTADLLLDYVPEERIKDVLYFAPFDMEYPISFNVMEDVGPDKRHLVANGLMSAFKKIWVDAWSARMEYILNNILLALLEYPDSTILGVNRMLADKDYRKKVVENISDVSVKAFWVDEFAKYGERYMQEAGAAIQNKIGQFISNPLVRNIVGQPHSAFDLRRFIDERKILIVNLSKGRVGEANANLLGSMLVTKIYLSAMSRADVHDSTLQKLPNFYLYVDEFQSFANESFADILSEARKYKLNLTIAHQYIEQMSDEVRAAVFGNVGTMISFRVGAFDAEVLEKEFAPQFTAQDMVNLGFTQVYLKLMIDGVTSPPFSATTLPPIDRQDTSFKNDVIEYTRKAFARPRAEIEGDIKEWSEAHRVLASVGPKKEIRQATMVEKFPVVEKPAQIGGAPLARRPTPLSQSIPPSPPLRFEPRMTPKIEPRIEPLRTPSVRETQAVRIEQKPISLDALKPQKKEGTSDVQKNKEDLRNALAQMLKKDKPAPDVVYSPQENAKISATKIADASKTFTKKTTGFQTRNLDSREPVAQYPHHGRQRQGFSGPKPMQSPALAPHEGTSGNEIPEKVLRKLLEVDSPK